MGLRGLRRVQLRTQRVGKPCDKEVGLASSQDGAFLFFNDSLLEPEFQGSCVVGSMWVGIRKLE